MPIIILIIVLILAVFIGRNFFDKNRRAKTQDIINSIRNEKNFWFLMRQEINAERVYRVYLGTRNQGREILVGDLVMNLYSKYTPDPSDFDKTMISKDDPIRMITSLNSATNERENIINSVLEEQLVSFSETDIKECFEDLKTHSNDLTEVKKHYDRFMTGHLELLLKGDKTGVNIWKKLKEFSEKERDFEFDSSGEKYVDFLVPLKMLQTDMNSAIVDLLWEKIKDKEAAAKIKKALTEWRQLNMLIWCIVDYSFWEVGKNGIQTTMWRIATAPFLLR